MSSHPQPNSYQIVIYLKRKRQIRVGALGNFVFKRGYYVYTGSAKRNLQARLTRHCRKDKPSRWHIDYMTNLPDADVVGCYRLVGDECALNQKCPGSIPVPGFGASDCQAGCGAHLKYLGPKLPANSTPAADDQSHHQPGHA